MKKPLQGRHFEPRAIEFRLKHDHSKTLLQAFAVKTAVGVSNSINRKHLPLLTGTLQARGVLIVPTVVLLLSQT